MTVRCAREVVAIKWEIADGGKFVYGSMRVENVRVDEALENLYLTMVYANHEWQVASYSGVYYNEITERGAVIVMAAEYPLSALKSPNFMAARERFALARGKPTPMLYAELAERDIKLFAHYIKGKEGESIILARRAEICEKVQHK